MAENRLIPVELTEKIIESMIYEVRGQKVMLDYDLARIFGYQTKTFNQQVKNNQAKFPERYRFQLTVDETVQISRSKKLTAMPIMQSAGTKGGRTSLPYAFTEQGIYMLMTVLKGELATKQSIALIDAFKSMKDYIIENRPLLGHGELIKLIQTVDEHSVAISEMRNDLKAVMDNFIDETTYKHFTILDGEKIEADVAYQTIYKRAKTSILIIDDYIDVKTLQLLKAAKKGVGITIISDNKAKNDLNANFIQDSGLALSFKRSNAKFHDRYIVLDYKMDNELFFHCGASSKDAGNRITAINKLGDGKRYYTSIDIALSEPDYKID